jgi:very-short-patch-repair endonuclease
MSRWRAEQQISDASLSSTGRFGDIHPTDLYRSTSRERREGHPVPMELSAVMARTGHLASRRQLAAAGIGRHLVDRGLREGGVIRVRPGWVATLEADQLAIIAVLRGARLTGATALRSYGIWAGDDRRIHLQLPPNAHRVQQHPLTPIASFTRPKFTPRGVVNHWGVTPQRNAEFPPGIGAIAHLKPEWRVTLADAIVMFAATESDEQLAAAMESAAHEKRLSHTAVMNLFQRLPRRQRRLAARLNFCGESGMETIARMRLEALGLRLAQQVRIATERADTDRVDFVIDGWLIVELDGDEWHDPIEDRIRTNRLIRAGYRVLRFGYAEVFERWDETAATILEMLGIHASV